MASVSAPRRAAVLCSGPATLPPRLFYRVWPCDLPALGLRPVSVTASLSHDSLESGRLGESSPSSRPAVSCPRSGPHRM